MAMKTLSVVLEREGYETHTAEDGNVAIDLLMKNNYDLLVVDIHLPYRSGLELVKYVRSDLQKDTPAIILTAFSDHQMQRQAGELGISDYIVKPFNPGDLLEKSNQFSTNNSCTDLFYFYLLGFLSPVCQTSHSLFRRKRLILKLNF